jgi:hypothetical protein
MKLAKSILCGAAALGLASASALAMDESTSSVEEAYVIADSAFDGQGAWNASPSYDMAYSLYGVDDDMDGRPDRYLIIEQSDTLASSQNDADLDNPYGG